MTKEKGYDLLIQAFAILPAAMRSRTKVVIVASGDELLNLRRQVVQLKLSDNIFFVNWLAIEDFKALIYSIDIFVHPARFDSYGGTTLGMALGVPAGLPKSVIKSCPDVSSRHPTPASP